MAFETSICLPASTASTLPTSISSLQLPSSSANFSSTLSELKRSTLSPHNRLQSILHDSDFVREVASNYSYPCIANERCGSWYIPPELKAGSAYFKSTDGHHGQWDFSLRRLNLHLLDGLGESGGCIIVDSTRRGKSMPDALSKTVPIWCTVMNRLLFEASPEEHRLYTPEEVVSESEHIQIEARIETFVRQAKSLELDLEKIRSSVKHPLRPIRVTPGSSSPPTPDSDSHNIIICCTASRRVQGAENSEDGYIQGAGDDSEAWSHGLTPSLFWSHIDELITLDEEEYVTFVKELLGEAQSKSGLDSSELCAIGSTGLYVGCLDGIADIKVYDAIISYSGFTCRSSHGEQQPDEIPKRQSQLLELRVGTGKLGGRALRSELPRLFTFLEPVFTSSRLNQRTPKILIAGPVESKNDISIGIALAIHCVFHDSNASTPNLRDAQNPQDNIDKMYIKRHLSQITASIPSANPSRTTLQSVHAFLMPAP